MVEGSFRWHDSWQAVVEYLDFGMRRVPFDFGIENTIQLLWCVCINELGAVLRIQDWEIGTCFSFSPQQSKFRTLWAKFLTVSGVLQRSLTNNVSINFNVMALKNLSFQKMSKFSKIMSKFSQIHFWNHKSRVENSSDGFCENGDPFLSEMWTLTFSSGTPPHASMRHHFPNTRRPLGF